MPASVKHLYFTFTFILVCFNQLIAQQTPYLEKVVTIKAASLPLSEVFKIISNQTGVVFSYTQPFDDKKKTTITCQKKPLRLVLVELFKASSCSYKAKDKYIIIKCEGKPVQPPSVLTGYIYNRADSTIVPQASIYVKQTKHSAVSNEYGFFSISYSNKLPNITLSVAKEDYKDTSVIIFNQNKQEVVIYLYPQVKENKKNDTLAVSEVLPAKDSLPVAAKDTLQPKKNYISLFLEKSKKVGANLKNISDTMFADVSVSFTPYISTNRLLSVNTVNKYALNILGGYSMGTRVLEVGGLFNIDKEDVTGTQLAGLFNLVGDSVKGAQLAGVLNVTGKSMTGFQASGVMNMNLGSTKGVQLSGLINVNKRKLTGVSIAGITTMTDTLNGAAFAGMYNSTGYSKKSLEMAGLFNHTNRAENNYQFSCIFNSSLKGSTNSQLSVFYNRAAILRGMQVGFINYADSASGVPVGFLSIVKKGYHKIELSSDEMMFASIAVCTGVRKFYNIFFAGMNYSDISLWTYGVGFGSDLALKHKFGLTFNATAQQIQSNENTIMDLNLLDKLYIGATYNVFPKIQVNLGPTFNIFIADTSGKVNSSTLDDLPLFNIYNPDLESDYIRMFIGLKLGIKFF